MIFITSDWHLSHDREFIYKPRGFNSIEEMNDAIIERHNSIVTPEDDVYVLGDLCLGGAESLERNRKLISSMNGKLHIAFGNHDTPARRKMYAELPSVVEAAWAIMLDYNKYHFYMSHFPTLTGNLEKESLRQMTLNLYGHTHQNTNFFEDRPYMFHVGVDSHDCYPVPIDEVIAVMKQQVEDCKYFLGLEDIDQIHNSKESDIHKVIMATVANWPDWKKQVYNDCIAISRHANKIK